MSADKEKEGWSGFSRLCLALKDTSLLDEFFELFMTPQEKQDFSTRFLIVRDLLKHEKSQRSMALDLDVSIAKITRGSNSLKKCSSELIEFIKKNVD